MNAFHFRLQRVLDFRRMQFQIAESECQRAGAKLHAIQAQQASLSSQKSATRKLFAGLANVEARDLAPLPNWYQWTITVADHLTRLERTAAQELQKRREALVEAQRKVRLLEKLRDNRHAQWQADFDREIEELAADATNSRYSLEAGPRHHRHAG
jgi:flagellar export protein FliJ